MKDVKDITVCVVDHGQFIPVARKIGEQVKKCYYWSPDEKSLKLVQEGVIGDGFPEIVRVSNGKSFWDVKDECDLFVFPDIGFAGEQRELIRQGKPVWGARGSDTIESNRGKFLKILDSLGMNVPPHKIIKGLTNLRLHLKDEEDKFVKISDWRGNFETFHWTNWKEGEGELDNYAVEFGPTKELVTFYVFDRIDTEIEDGIDAYCIDGVYPRMVLHGMENKDKSYCGVMTEWDNLPEQVRTVNEQFSPALGDYRGFFCTEVRITEENESYFIDPTCRAPSPPHQLMTELFGNFADIIWNGANGVCIDPEPTAKVGVQALLSCSRNDREWASFVIPEKIEPQVKCGFCCQIGDRLAFPPHQLETMCGYLVATGDTIEEAVGNLQAAVKELPDGMKCEDKSIAELLKEIQSAEDKGMEFTDEKIPEPSIVLGD
jgi:hypothetical protein